MTLTSVADAVEVDAGLSQASDADRLAASHAACLPGSVLSALGPAVLRRYYAFADRSPSEMLLVARCSGEIVGACIVSDSPDSLMSRFSRRYLFAVVARTGLGIVFNARVRAFVRSRFASRSAAGEDLRHGRPELLQIFSAAETRSRGVGRSLIDEVDRRLTERGIGSYLVKTETDGGNRAIGFYLRNGYREVLTASVEGKRYTYFEKLLEVPVATKEVQHGHG